MENKYCHNVLIFSQWLLKFSCASISSVKKIKPINSNNNLMKWKKALGCNRMPTIWLLKKNILKTFKNWFFLKQIHRDKQWTMKLKINQILGWVHCKKTKSNWMWAHLSVFVKKNVSQIWTIARYLIGLLIKFRQTSLFTVLVFSGLTICGPENREKPLTRN